MRYNIVKHRIQVMKYYHWHLAEFFVTWHHDGVVTECSAVYIHHCIESCFLGKCTCIILATDVTIVVATEIACRWLGWYISNRFLAVMKPPLDKHVSPTDPVSPKFRRLNTRAFPCHRFMQQTLHSLHEHRRQFRVSVYVYSQYCSTLKSKCKQFCLHKVLNLWII
jgi:hypothetical protein